MTRPIAIIQLGVGQIGQAVATIVEHQARLWREEYDLDIQYRALVDSSAVMEVAAAGDLDQILRIKRDGLSLSALEHARPLSDVPTIVRQSCADDAAESVAVIDCSAGSWSVQTLLCAREAGARVVLANKDPLAGSYDQFAKIAGSARWAGISATVGAGLPVLTALARMRATGDSLLSVSARASGSLGFLCDRLSLGDAFDVAVRAAAKAGYTEPDPRTDLAGTDVARKLVILGRVAGLRLDLAHVKTESLVPADLAGDTLNDFWHNLHEHAGFLAQRAKEARAAGKVVRYIAEIDDSGRATAGLRAVAPDDLLAQGSGPQNVFVLRTSRYADYPLQIAGPGAGVEVTAGAVVADLLSLAGAIAW